MSGEYNTSVTTASLIADVKRRTKDTQFEDSYILELLNDGLFNVAGLVALPSLKVVTTLTTSTSDNVIDLPTAMHSQHRGLFFCYNTSDSRHVDIYQSQNLLLADYPDDWDKSGALFAVAPEVSQLFYVRIPDSEKTLRVHYYQTPTKLISDLDVPDCMPQAYARRLLVSYVCRELYSMVDDGTDGDTGYANVSFYNAKFNAVLEELKLFLGPVKTAPENTYDVHDWEWW